MITSLPSGEIEFKVFIPHAESVEVLGTFTDWMARPYQLQRSHEGWWTGRIRISPGDHDFQYRIDGVSIMADYAAHGVKLNPYGQWISRLAVQNLAA